MYPFRIKVTFNFPFSTFNSQLFVDPSVVGKPLPRLFSPTSVEKRFGFTRIYDFVPLSFVISPCSAQDDEQKECADIICFVFGGSKPPPYERIAHVRTNSCKLGRGAPWFSRCREGLYPHVRLLPKAAIRVSLSRWERLV